MNQSNRRSNVAGALGSAAMTAMHLQNTFPTHQYYDTAQNHANIAVDIGRTFFGTIIHRIQQLVYFTLTGAFMLTTSIIMYALAYYAIMPENHATEPIFFDYNYKGCDVAPCPPTAIIDLASLHTQWQAHVPEIVYHFNEEEDDYTIPQTCDKSKDNSCIKGAAEKERHEVENKISRVMIPNQSYFIQVALTLPESEFNRQLGMFMIEIRLKSRIKKDVYNESIYGERRNENNPTAHSPTQQYQQQRNEEVKLLARSARPAMLPYQSAYVSSVKKSFIMLPLILGAVPEARTVVIECFDHYKESKTYPMTLVEVRLVVPKRHSSNFGGSGNEDAPLQNVQVLDAELRIGKELSRIQRFMQVRFYTSMFLGIMFFILLQIGLRLFNNFLKALVKNAVDDDVHRGGGDRGVGSSGYEFHGGDDISEFSNMNSPGAKIYSNARPGFFDDDELSDEWIPTVPASTTERAGKKDESVEQSVDQSVDEGRSSNESDTEPACLGQTINIDTKDNTNIKTRHEEETEQKQNEDGGKPSKLQKRRKKEKNLSSDKSELRGMAATENTPSNNNQTHTRTSNQTTEAERIVAERVMRGEFDPYEIFTDLDEPDL